MAVMVRMPCTAIGPRTGYPVQTHNTMVLESDNSECIPKNRPANPKLARAEDPLGFSGKSEAPVPIIRLVDRSMASNARRRPNLFHPPFSACIIGHMGLLVQKANFAMLDAIKPMLNDDTLFARRAGLPRSAYQVADQARQDIETPKPTAKRRYSGDLTRYASRPERDRR